MGVTSRGSRDQVEDKDSCHLWASVSVFSTGRVHLSPSLRRNQSSSNSRNGPGSSIKLQLPKALQSWRRISPEALSRPEPSGQAAAAVQDEGRGWGEDGSWPLKAPSHQRPGSGFLRLQSAGRISSFDHCLDTP